MIFDTISPKYLKEQLDKLSNLNLALTDLRDSIIGSDSRSLTDIYNKLGSISGSVSVSNFPTWFTSSTKTTDDLLSDLDALKGALASVGTDKFNVELSGALPSGDNWIGRVKVGDGTNIASIVSGTLLGNSEYLLGVAPDMTTMFKGGDAYTEQEVSVSTTSASSSFSPPLKVAVLTNEGDTDITITLNGGSTNKTIHAKASKVIEYFPISSISYSVASGSSTLKIEGYW